MNQEKRHTACDECRRKKLKCTGELEGCVRCRNEGISCIYSYRKQMGRPRKHKLDEGVLEPPQGSHLQAEDMVISPVVSDSENLQRGPYYSPTQQPMTFGDIEWAEVSGFLDISTQASDTVGVPPNYRMVEYTDLTSTSNAALDPDIKATCTCLAQMYLATADLQAGSQQFPFHLKPIRAAMEIVKQLTHCEVCAQRKRGGNQNLLLITSLLHTIVEHIEALLISIDEETRAANTSGSTKELCLGDNSVENLHLHSHTPDCPARFSVTLEPEEWRKLAMRTVIQEVRGTIENRLTFEGLLDELEARQHFFHTVCEADPSIPHGTPPQIPGDFTCLRLLSQVRKAVLKLPVP